MGMNPLVGHKVDRYWAEVGSLSIYFQSLQERSVGMDCNGL